MTIHTEPLPREKLRDIADQPELLVAMAILVAFVVLASLQVFTRYVLGNQFVWTEELSGNLLIWLTFLGATAIERRDGHVRLQTLQEMLPPSIYLPIYALYDLIILVWLGCLIYGGWILIGQLNFELTPALKIPYRYVLAIVPVTALIMSFYVFVRMMRNFGLLRRRDGR